MLELRKRYLSGTLIVLVGMVWAALLASVIFNITMSEETSDIHNYIANFDRFSVQERFRTQNLFLLLVNESVFHYSYQKLSEAFLSPEIVLRIFTFTFALLMLATASRASLFRFAWVFAILSHPRVIDMLVSQQRSAIAVTLFCFGIRAKSNVTRTLLFTLAVGVHTSSFVMVAGYLMYQASQRWHYFRKFLIFLSFLVIVFVMTILQQLVLQFIGSHRGGTSAGFLYTVMMLGLFAYVFMTGPRLSKDVFLFFGMVMIAAVGVAFFLDQYSSRFMAFGLVFLAFSNYDPPPMSKVMFSYMYIGSLILSYYFWL